MAKPRLNDKKLRELERRVTELGSKRAHVGILQSEGAVPKRDSKLSMVEIAAVHEFGSPKAGIPERSFIRRTFDEQRDEFTTMAKLLGRAVMLGKMTADQALNLIGLKGATEVKRTITSGEGVPPKLSPVTIAKKGSDRPLVDTGQLVNSITHEVRGGTR